MREADTRERDNDWNDRDIASSKKRVDVKGETKTKNEAKTNKISSSSGPVGGTTPLPQNFSARLTWQFITESDLKGYEVYVGTKSGIYDERPPAFVGLLTEYDVRNLVAGTTYYFSLKAIDPSGNKSQFASEVSTSIF